MNIVSDSSFGSISFSSCDALLSPPSAHISRSPHISRFLFSYMSPPQSPHSCLQQHENKATRDLNSAAMLFSLVLASKVMNYTKCRKFTSHCRPLGRRFHYHTNILLGLFGIVIGVILSSSFHRIYYFQL